MIRKLLFKPICTILGVLFYMNADATIHIVQTSNYVFNPSTMNVTVGDTVRWVRVNGSHTTTSRTIPGGAASWDQDLNSGNTTFDYKVTVAGTYNYVCEPHEDDGMVGSFTAASISTGIADAGTPAFKLYPNPFTDELVIDSDEDMEVHLYDLLGKEVNFYHITKGNGKTRIETASLTSGIYMVNIKYLEAKEEKTVKVVKAGN